MNIYQPKGLDNFTYNNCYMNSLLQCLFYCKEFRDKLLEIEIKSSNSFLILLRELFMQLNNSKYQSFPAKKIKDYLNEYKFLQNENGADVTDLFDFIFSNILYEDKDEDSIKTVKYEEKVDNKSAMFNEIKNEIDDNLIINKFFLGFYESEYQCKCKKENYKYVFQNEYRIVFPLEEISQYYNNKSNITIYDCFEYNQKKIINMEEKCRKCKKNYILKEKIYKLPNILIIILNRGKNKRYNKTVEFNEEINLTNYIDENEKNNNSNKFKLIGVIKHIGKCGSFGHYISYCLCDDNNYYLFNDCNVKKIKENKKKKLFEGTPYVLFYRNIEKQNQIISKKKEKNQIQSLNNDKNICNTIESYIITLNKINEDISKNIDLIIKNFGFILIPNQNNLLWKNKNDDSVDISFNSKIITIIFCKNFDKKDKKNKYNNTLYNWKINLDNKNEMSDFFNNFKNKFNEFFKY